MKNYTYSVWDRSELKRNAKKSLHGNLWTCIFCMIAYLVIQGEWFGVVFSDTEAYFRIGLGTAVQYSFDIIRIPINITLVSLIGLATLAYSIFISNPIEVGKNHFFLENRETHSTFDAFFYAFYSGHYLNIVKVMFLRDLFTSLWTLLFIIPGIYKAYQYYCISYILADDASLDYADVFAMTKGMTNGAKFEIFVLEISFILWLLLGVITFGLATFYVTPYIQQTMAEAYCYLRDGEVQPTREDILYDNPTE